MSFNNFIVNKQILLTLFKKEKYLLHGNLTSTPTLFQISC